MRLILAAILLLGVPLRSVGQSTRPAASTEPSMSEADLLKLLDVYSNAAFLDEDFDGARQLLDVLADHLKKDPARHEKLLEVEKKIEVCKKKHIATTSAEAAKAANSTEVRTPHPAPKAGEILETTPAELGNFEFDEGKGSKIPDDVKALSGTTVRVTGYMYPIDGQMKTAKFVLQHRLSEIPVHAEHEILVTCPKGKTVEYLPGKVTVEGKLTVVPSGDGEVTGIFQMECDKVTAVSKK